MENRKLPTEAEVAGWLRKDQLLLPPLRFKLKPADALPANSRGRWDYAVEANWKDQTAKFAVESKKLSTPKTFDEALQQCKSRPLPKGYYPLVLMPYLRQTQLEELERNELAGRPVEGQMHGSRHARAQRACRQGGWRIRAQR